MESALVHLKAELHRRKAEAKQGNKNALPTHFTPLKRKPSENLKKQNQKNVLEVDDEELKKLQKSREALEKKSALYNKIKSGSHDLNEEENERYLVDFQEKLKEKKAVDYRHDGRQKSTYSVGVDKVKDLENGKIEFVDEFGRTRICEKEEMEYYGVGKPDLNAFHEKWDKIDEETKEKSNVHYQDVLFDEARSHGASFMAFSRDEKERAEQQQFLRDLGAEAEKARVTKKGLEKKRRKLMEQRLAKVRQKKRLKMGLPIKDDEFKTPPTSDEEIEDQPISEATPPPLPTPEPPPEDPPTKKVREWDVGKPGVTMSQEQWVESRRRTRENEFAPPSSYDQSHCDRMSSNNRKTPVKVTHNPGKHPAERAMPGNKTPGYAKPLNQPASYNPVRTERVNEFAPPSTYDYYNSTSSKRSHSLGSKIDLEAAISKGISNLREQFSSNRNKDRLGRTLGDA